MSYMGMPEKLTIGALLDTALACETTDEAKAMLADYRAENPDHADANLGYVFGYVEPSSRRAALYDLFEGISHPIFGANWDMGFSPTPPKTDNQHKSAGGDE